MGFDVYGTCMGRVWESNKEELDGNIGFAVW